MEGVTKIYLVSNIGNNPNRVYVGKTKTNNREREHKSKFGKEILFTIIDEVDSLERAYWEPLETYWIEQFRQWGFILENKKTKGGSGVEYQTIETIEKIREKHLNSDLRGEKHHNYGKTNTWLSNYSKSMSGENHPMFGKRNVGASENSKKRVGKLNPNSMPVEQICLVTNKVINEFESISIASKKVGVSEDSISFWVRGIRKPKGLFTFRKK